MSPNLLRCAHACTLLSTQSPASAQEEGRGTIEVAASASFGIGYRIWLWGKSRKMMSSASRAEHDAIIADDLYRSQKTEIMAVAPWLI